MELKKCTISGVVDYESNFYKNGTYPYATFVEKFRSKYNIPVDELRFFCNEIRDINRLELEKISYPNCK